MPTYEYRCEKGHEFERFQRMSEAPVDSCPTCGAPAERLLSAGGGLLFKGSGFYITDYRKDSYKKAAEADSGGSGEKKSGGDGKADSGSKSAAPAKSEGGGKADAPPSEKKSGGTGSAKSD